MNCFLGFKYKTLLLFLIFLKIIIVDNYIISDIILIYNIEVINVDINNKWLFWLVQKESSSEPWLL